MTMLKNLASAVDLTGTAIGPGKLCNVSPFLGGQGHKAILRIQDAPGGAAVVKIQGNPAAGSTAPSDGDAGWYDIASLTSASPLEQEVTLDRWMRYNITTLGTGALTADLQGVQ